MRRFPALLCVVITLVFGLAGCGGSKNIGTVGPPAKVTVSPSPVSLTLGDTAQLSPTVTDSSGNVLIGQTFTFQSSNTSFVTVSNGGLVCAGTWDSLTTPVVCTPPTTGPLPSPAGNITVTTSSISATVPVYEHPHVDAITVTPVMTGCLSAGGSAAETNTFTAKAFNKGTDITSLVGPLNWTVSPSTIATVNTSGLCSTDNTCVITAAQPGQANVTASVAGTVSTPSTFTTCPVQQISLHVSGGTDTSASFSSIGNTATLAADVTDTKGNTLSATSLFYDTVQPVVAFLATGTLNLTAAAPGATSLVASCTPPSCNTNLYPVYSNPFQATVSGTSATTVYVASTSSTTLLPVDSSANTVGTAITLPNQPNSLMATPNGAKLVLGSSSGVMVVDTTSGGVTTTSAVVGKVIGVSPDSSTAMVSDPATGTLYTYTIPTANYVTTAFGVEATHASWSPDALRAYVVGGDKLAVLSTGTTPRISTIGTVNDVDFLKQGSFAYLAGGSANVSVYATCNNADVSGVATPGRPALIRGLPNGREVVAADPPYVDVINASTDGAGCPPAIGNSEAHYDLGAGSFSAKQLVVTPDSNTAFVLGDQPSLLRFDLATNTPTAVPLASPITGITTGGTTLDSKLLFFGVAGSNTLEKYDIGAGTLTPISVSISPDLVAVRPK